MSDATHNYEPGVLYVKLYVTSPRAASTCVPARGLGWWRLSLIVRVRACSNCLRVRVCASASERIPMGVGGEVGGTPVLNTSSRILCPTIQATTSTFQEP
jgi:hypothetical protein